jgi:hypothetical protein
VSVLNRTIQGEKMKKNLAIFVGMLLLLVYFSGCGTRKCLEPSSMRVDSKKLSDSSKIMIKTHMGKRLSEAMAVPVTKAGPRPLNILILSGGGQNGAFGAGFLNGLAMRPDNPNLNFDIVTGISTGALQATFAFLGPEYFGSLEDAYTNVSQKDIFYNRFFLSLLWSDSIADTAPLRSFLEKMITLDTLKEVAKAHESGRRLFVGTVDLDRGDLVVWNMGEIAQELSEQSLKKYHNILMAAAAIPLLFPPVKIEYQASTGELYEGLHVDGGAREILFFRLFMLDLRDTVKLQVQRLQVKIARLDQAQLTVVVNGKIGVGYDCIDNRLIPIGKRSLATLLDETTVNGVLRAYIISCANGISFRMIRIPDHIDIEPDEHSFNPDTMQMLFDEGQKIAQSDPIPWETKPPTGEDIELICK